VPELGIPIVPLLTNCLAPPIATSQRFREIGTIVRRCIASYRTDRRVAVIASGHLSLDLGGPLGAGPGAVDADFDERAIAWLRDGHLDEAVRECTFDRLLRIGHLTLAYMNFIMAAASPAAVRLSQRKVCSARVRLKARSSGPATERDMSTYLVDKFLYRSPSAAARSTASRARSEKRSSRRHGRALRDGRAPAHPVDLLPRVVGASRRASGGVSRARGRDRSSGFLDMIGGAISANGSEGFNNDGLRPSVAVAHGRPLSTAT
jgi:hypothetical protein